MELGNMRFLTLSLIVLMNVTVPLRAIAGASGGFFVQTGGMNAPRTAYTATGLLNGQVLITGGSNGAGDLATAEVYSAGTGQFTLTGSMGIARDSHTATLFVSGPLKGKVLITGGFGPPTPGCNCGAAPTSEAELYNPATGKFTVTGPMTTARAWHTATLLRNGQVLITGGVAYQPLPTEVSSAELFIPSSGTFQATGSLQTPRSQHTATLLDFGPNAGEVLIVGGFNNGDSLAAAEIYNPVSRTFSATGTLHTARFFHTATLFSAGPLNHQVLIVGGFNFSAFTALTSAELYNPRLGTFTSTGAMSMKRFEHAATLLCNNTVLISGGYDNTNTFQIAEIYNPLTRSFGQTGSMALPRRVFSSIELENMEVLVGGGLTGGTSVTNAAEIYHP